MNGRNAAGTQSVFSKIFFRCTKSLTVIVKTTESKSWNIPDVYNLQLLAVTHCPVLNKKDVGLRAA